MAKKLPRLGRTLDAPALFSIAYGEIASSIYFALGIIAFHALGFTPVILLVAGALFLLVSLSYAEGTAAIRETGGAATFVRIAFNDFWGFVTGWVLFLDYLIVIALSALYVPHYAAAAMFTTISKPWDVVAGCAVIAGIATFRLLRNRRIFRFALVIARRSRHAAAARHPRPGSLVLAARVGPGDVAGHQPDLALDPLRASAGDARLHGPGDRR